MWATQNPCELYARAILSSARSVLEREMQRFDSERQKSTGRCLRLELCHVLQHLVSYLPPRGRVGYCVDDVKNVEKEFHDIGLVSFDLRSYLVTDNQGGKERVSPVL
jgi:hypothetical protein